MGGPVAARPVRVGELLLDGARTAIIAPLVADDPIALGDQAARAAACRDVDLLEWRVDAMLARADLGACADAVRAGADGAPVLATIRTAREGGGAQLQGRELLQAQAALLEAGGADLLDVEILADPEEAAAAIDLAHERAIPVVGSHHRFDATPSIAAMVEALTTMEAAGADLVKLAVMPHSPADVLALMEATLQARERLEVPLITIAMGRLGALTRLSGTLLGQAATFATLEESSAPGQLDAGVVAAALRALGAR